MVHRALYLWRASFARPNNGLESDRQTAAQFGFLGRSVGGASARTLTERLQMSAYGPFAAVRDKATHDMPDVCECPETTHMLTWLRAA